MVDLTQSVHDKYGHPLSFQLKLRIQDGDPQIIKYKNPVSPKWNDAEFGAIISDNRSRKIELIREVEEVRGAYETSIEIRNDSNSQGSHDNDLSKVSSIAKG